MDDWTHPTHGPDGNLVSNDKLVQFPLGLRWLEGVPMNFNLWASCRGVVVADGRCFTLNTAEYENIAPMGTMKHIEHEYLLARDAYNGMPLWKADCETINDGKALNSRNVAPIATDGKRVYIVKKDKLVAFDAATGKVVQNYETKFPTVRLALDKGVLISSGWEARHAPGLWDPWVIKTDAGTTEAFDAQSGKLKWKYPYPAQHLLTADGNAYLLVQGGAPSGYQTVVALDLQSGKEKWKVEHTSFPAPPPADPNKKPEVPKPFFQLMVAGQGVLVVGRPANNAISMLSAADGKVLWELKSDANWVPIVGGLIWSGDKKLDPKTGTVQDTYSGVGWPGICTPNNIVGNIVTNTRGCSYHVFEAANPKHAKTISYRGARRVHRGGGAGQRHVLHRAEQLPLLAGAGSRICGVRTVRRNPDD